MPNHNRGQATADVNVNNNKKSRILFDPSKCVVISKTLDKKGLWGLKDDHIKREIGKNCGPVIIDRIQRTGKSSQNLLVQLGSEEMAEEVLSKWKPPILDGTIIRKVKQHTVNQIWGVAKGVPDDITDEDFTSLVKEKYGGQSASRMWKYKDGEKVPLKTMKIKFNDKHSLMNATNFGITMGYISMRVEEFVNYSKVVQCYKCKRYGHMSMICTRPEACDNCGEVEHTTRDESCHLQTKCVNCGGNHNSRNRMECAKYNELRNKLDQRHHG